MQRPDKLKIVMPGDGPASEFYYDGKTMMAYAPAENLVAVADAPPTIDAALMAAYNTAAIFFPFTDLLVADPYAALTDGAILAFYIGPSIGGRRRRRPTWWRGPTRTCSCRSGSASTTSCRGGSVRSMPRDPLQLRNELELSNWKLDSPIAPETFTSPKALAAPHIAFKARPPRRRGHEAAGQDGASQGAGSKTAAKVTLIGGPR